MSDHSNKDKTAFFEAIGYEIGTAIARGMLRGILHEIAEYDALMEAAESVTEISTNEEAATERDGHKTQIKDCQACWCNTCANLEKCVIKKVHHAPLEERVEGVPWPCLDCRDGMRFMPLEKERRCDSYVEGGANYG